MLKIKSKPTVSIPPVEEGTYPAVCVGVVDLGEQHNKFYNKYEHKILLIMELPGELIEIEGEQKPRWVSRDFTASLGQKANLTQFLNQWRGKALTEEERENGFDLAELLNRPGFASVGVVEGKDRLFNVLNGMMSIPKGMPAPTAIGELLWFDMDDWNDEVFQKLPGWVQDRIKKSTQYQKQHAPAETIEVKANESGCPF